MSIIPIKYILANFLIAIATPLKLLTLGSKKVVSEVT